MDKGKPGLALLIGHALAQKGKAKHDPMPEHMDKMDESDHVDHMDHLEEVMKDLLQAFEDKDPKAMAELFHEAFQVCDAEPHVEGSHEE